MSEILVKKEAVFDIVYKMIKTKANSNAFIQAVSGVVGFPSTLAVDGLVILTHYEPMINDIRRIYGRTPVSVKEFLPVFRSMLKEILLDFAVDKVLGHIPIAGVYFNAISAKALTWRLGMLVAVVSSKGEEFTKENLGNLVRLIRYITPQTDVFKFTTPDYEMFRKIVLSVADNEAEVFENKIQTALRAFE